MDGIHDLGGMQGFGAVDATPDEPPFHEPWEGRVHGVMLASAIAVPGSSIRPYVERMGNAAYLTTSYYEHWLAAVEARLVGAGVVTREELDERQAAILGGHAAVGERRDPEAAALVRSLFRPSDITDPAGAAPRFAAGDQVRVRRMHPRGHTRCPRYVRGAAGTVARAHAAQPLPDPNVDGDAPPEPYYSVAFSPTALWGDDAEPGAATIHVDLWESYLDGIEP
ncbi:MAG: nitrile hydratase subunit beta [Acidimicrobiales bacterium]